MDRGQQLAWIALKTKGDHGFDKRANRVARVRNVSNVGSQISKPQVGFELSTVGPVRIERGWAVLKQLGELLHCKPGLADQRPKSPFGKFFVIWNGEASMRR